MHETTSPNLRRTIAQCLLLLAFLPATVFADNNPLRWDDVIGLNVTVENSENCSGSNASPQTASVDARLTGGVEGCPYTLAITVTGSVETQNAAYDYVYVNGVLFFSGDEAAGECAMTTKTQTREIQVNAGDTITLTYDTSDGLYHSGAEATITAIQLVEGNCGSNCSPGAGTIANGSVKVDMKLGRVEFGRTAGALRIEESHPSAALGTPASLRYSSAWEDVDVVLDTNDAIRQIKAPQTLSDVVEETANRFRVDFYDPDSIGPLVGDLYDQSGEAPFVTWTFENLDPVDNLHFRVTETRGVSSKVSDYVWPVLGEGWELVTGNGQRKHKKLIVNDAGTSTSVVTEEIRNGADTLVSRIQYVYKDFPWGRELISTTVDPGGASLVTTRNFYDNPATDGTSYTRLKSTVAPHGRWTRYYYDASGRRIKTVEPFLDAVFAAADNLCKVTTVAFQTTAPQETEIVTILGTEVERTYRVFDRRIESGELIHETKDIVSTVAGAAYTASTNLVTTRHLVDRGDFTGETSFVKYPGGEVERYTYSSNGTTKTTVLTKGYMDGVSFVPKTVSSTTIDSAGNLVEESVIDSASGLLLSSREVLVTDAVGRPELIAYDDASSEVFVYGCCGLQSHTDREGVVTEYGYDTFGRVILEARAGITMATSYDADGKVLTRQRIGSDESVVALETNTYDLAGRLTSRTDALNQTTTFSELVTQQGHLMKIEKFDWQSRGDAYHADGRLFFIIGAASRPQYFAYGIESGKFFKRTIAGTSAAGTEWRKDLHDLAGRIYQSVQNGGGTSSYTYDNAGRLVKEVDGDGVAVLYSYYPDGTPHHRALDINRTNTIDANDPLIEYATSVVTAHGETVLRSETRVYDDDEVAHLAQREDRSTNGRRSWTEQWGLASSQTRILTGGGNVTDTIVRPDGSEEVRTYSQGRLLTETVTANAGATLVASRSFAYDTHGRAVTITDARSGAATRTYDNLDRVLTITSPTPVLTTSYQYDARGRVTKLTHPDLSETDSVYSPMGDLLARSGFQTPTLSFTYDLQGRIKTMQTTGQAGPATTTWNYSSTTGRLLNKTDAAGKAVSYTYTSAGRIQTRTWARGVATTYGYDWGGRHTSTVSGTVSLVLNLYNRLGQVIFKTDAAGSVDRTFTPDGRLLTETNGGGILGGMTVTHSYDGLHRRTGYSATMGGSSHSVTFGYDGASRLISISSGDDEATYTRFANAPLLSGLSRAHDSNHVVTTTWQHDFHNRLESVSSSTAAGPVSAHEYTYDALGRRVAAELGDGSGWDYGYDADGQVLSASRKRIVDESPVPGQQFAYTYDGIGNRTTAEVNGRTSVLSSNTLNQYTQRTVPGAIDVRGRALASAGVVVNDGIATRLDDAFHRAVPIDNSSGPQHPEVRVQALGAGAGPGGADLEAEEIGRVYLPGTPEVYSYDFDGNITGDGRWIYTWDFENRLVGMETVAGAPVTAKRKLEFLYDSESRRIRKRVYDWNGTAYVLSSNRRYLYDGWNLMAEIVASPTPFARTYVWGLDVSGSEQGSGGVGGLLAIREAGESHYPVYDGNGNVMALVRGSDEAISGRYHYGAFGEVLEVEEAGISNPFRFSTKFEDGETGLLYYGFRYYSPEVGRWLNRDPIEERGGVNLYGFVGNDGVGKVDFIGLKFTDQDYCDCLDIEWLRSETSFWTGTKYFRIPDDTNTLQRGGLDSSSWVDLQWKDNVAKCVSCEAENSERNVSNLEVRTHIVDRDGNVGDPLYGRLGEVWAPIAGPDRGQRFIGEGFTNQAPNRQQLPTGYPRRIRVQVIAGVDTVCEERTFQIQ